MASKSSLVRFSQHPLEQLFEGEPVFEFQTVRALERTLRDLEAALTVGPKHDESLVFEGVPHDTFERLSDRKSSLLFHCRCLYVHDSKTLMIKMISDPHDNLASWFGMVLATKFDHIGALSKIRTTGSGRKRMDNVSKEPDGSWGPHNKNYMTAVLEVGFSESSKKLALDARLWLEHPGSHVQQVITAKISPKDPRLVFQTWELGRQEYCRTRSGRSSQGQRVQDVTVTLENNVPKADGCISLSYHKIIEEPPAEGTPNDVILSAEDLADMARRVWQDQGLIPLGTITA